MSAVNQIAKHVYGRATQSLSAQLSSPILLQQEYDRLKAEVARVNPGDLAVEGFKVYSQNDEDGIIQAIFDRIGVGSSFCEIGVENGRECNTHFLSLKGWRGCWIEGSSKMCAQIEKDLDGREFPGRFKLIEAMVDCKNIASLYRDVVGFLGVKDLDFFSIDIDGNDLFVLDELVKTGARPAVLCLEYNGKFPPPLSISVEYDEARNWNRDDHFGASLQAFHDMLRKHEYGLVTCNVTGANAFYVRKDLQHNFDIVEPSKVWRPLRLALCPLPASHRPSLGFLRETLAGERIL